MKKLMMLGGNKFIIPVIKKAKEMGIYVITCDYLPDNYAHKFSDEYHNVSIIEKDAVLLLAKTLKIDGIMAFATDPGVTTAAYVAGEMGLPFAGSYESVSVLQDKVRFRKHLEENGFNVPKSFGVYKYTEILSLKDKISYPSIVKPADSAGSKGVTKVNKFNEFFDAFNYAITFSKSKKVIIEDFIEKQQFTSDSDGLSYNGNFEITTFNNQHFDNKLKNQHAPIAYTYPSTFSKENKYLLSAELNRLLKTLKLTSGLYNIETRVSDKGVPYLMEVSPRGGGNRLSEMVHLNYKVDLIEQAIRLSLGMNINDIKMKAQEKYMILIVHSHISGSFDKLVIDERFKTNVHEIDLWVKENEDVCEFEAANFALGTIIMKFDTLKEQLHFIDNHDEYVKVVLK